MLFSFRCIDAPNSLEKRIALREQHRARLQELQKDNRLTLVGQLLDAHGGEQIEGSLLIAEFKNLKQAQDWAKADPYNEQKVYQSVIIQPFNKVLPT